MDQAIIEAESEDDFESALNHESVYAHHYEEKQLLANGVESVSMLVDGRVRVEFSHGADATTVGQVGDKTPSAMIVQVH